MRRALAAALAAKHLEGGADGRRARGARGAELAAGFGAAQGLGLCARGATLAV